MTSDVVGLGVLGPLRLTVDAADVDVPGSKRRAVLALLAMASPEPIGVDGLVDALWPAAPPAAARQALQSHVSRLRRHLGPASHRLTAVGPGYQLSLEAGELDAARVAKLVDEGRRVAERDPSAALALLRDARALWRGPALDEFADVGPLAAWARSLTELRLDVSDLLVDCAVSTGDTSDALMVAVETVAAEPLREASVLLLVRALANCGRSAEALRAAHDYRYRLGDETGLEPSPALAELEHTIASGSASPPASPLVAPPPFPAPPSPMIGRDAELAGVARLIDSERVVTLVGPGGVGKTHLALAAAHYARARRDVALLALAPVTDGDAIADALAGALGLRGVTGDLLAACAERLRAGPQLLVVDNCEHLLDAAGGVVTTLSSACPELTILATSRERLGLATEQTCRLTPLPTPESARTEGVEDVPSVALFVERARRVAPGFEPTDEQLVVIADMVRHLDGMPLAIELAAGRLSSLGLDDLAGRLDRAIDLLGGGPSTSDGRHRTLRAAIEWSYELLPDDERRLFRILAVFPDGFDLPTAEGVARDLGCSTDPATALAHLVDASMLMASLAATPRYRMLDTLRSFALDRLDAEHERDGAVKRLLRWAVNLVRWIDATVRTEEEPLANARLRAELQNLREAWRTARSVDDLDTTIALVLSLDEAVAWRDLTEILGWQRELADDPRLVGHPDAASVLGVASDAAWMAAGDLEAAERLARRGLELARPDDEMGAKRCLAALSDLESFRGNYDRSRALALEAAGGPREAADAFTFAALAAAYGGDLVAARELNDRSNPRALTSLGFSRYVAAEVEGIAGDWVAAESHYREALDLAARSGSTFLAGIASVGLVSVLAASGQLHNALVGYRDLIDYWERTGGWTQQWTTLRNLASLLDDLGDHETARFLWSAADHAPEAAALNAGGERGGIGVVAGSRETVLDAARNAIDRGLESSAVSR